MGLGHGFQGVFLVDCFGVYFKILAVQRFWSACHGFWKPMEYIFGSSLMFLSLNPHVLSGSFLWVDVIQQKILF